MSCLPELLTRVRKPPIFHGAKKKFTTIALHHSVHHIHFSTTSIFFLVAKLCRTLQRCKKSGQNVCGKNSPVSWHVLRCRSSHIPLRSSCVQLSVYTAFSVLKRFLCAIHRRKQTDRSIANARCYPKLRACAEFRDVTVCTALIAIETPVRLYTESTEIRNIESQRPQIGSVARLSICVFPLDELHIYKEFEKGDNGDRQHA